MLENSSEELVRYPLVGNSEAEETIEPVTALVSPVLYVGVGDAAGMV